MHAQMLRCLADVTFTLLVAALDVFPIAATGTQRRFRSGWQGCQSAEQGIDQIHLGKRLGHEVVAPARNARTTLAKTVLIGNHDNSHGIVLCAQPSDKIEPVSIAERQVDNRIGKFVVGASSQGGIGILRPGLP